MIAQARAAAAKSAIEPRRTNCKCVDGWPCTPSDVVCVPCFWLVLRELAGFPPPKSRARA